MPRMSVLVLLAGFFFTGTPSAAQDIGDLSGRLDILARKIVELERHVYRAGVTPAPAGAARGAGKDPARAAGLEVGLQRLGDEFRRLTGSVEKLGHDVRVLNDRLGNLVADVDFRLSVIERAGLDSSEEMPGNAGPRGHGAAGTVAVGAVEEQYDFAFRLLLQKRLDEAEVALRSFIHGNADHALVSNAWYWLGEVHYVGKNYEQAADIFTEGYEKLPNGNKAPDSLLKLGISLARLGREEDACRALGELDTLFPDVPNTFKQQSEKAKRHAGCV